MSQSNSTSGGGIGFFGLLTIVLIVLKLTGTIDWPWLWVLSPAIAATSFVVVLLTVTLVTIWLINRRDNRR